MEMKGEQLIPAPQQAVWDALNDPGVLKACVPGCESLEKSGDNEYQVLMVARVGPVSAKFKGRLTLSDINPPSSYSISFEGQGGAAGFAKGSAQVDRKSTRLNSSHLVISYAVFCLKKKNLKLRIFPKWQLLPLLLNFWVCRLLMVIFILTNNVITSCSFTMMLFLHLQVKPIMTLTTVLYVSYSLISGHLAMMLMELTKRR